MSAEKPHDPTREKTKSALSPTPSFHGKLDYYIDHQYVWGCSYFYEKEIISREETYWDGESEEWLDLIDYVGLGFVVIPGSMKCKNVTIVIT